MKLIYSTLVVLTLILSAGSVWAEETAAVPAPDAAMQQKMAEMKVLSSASGAHEVFKNYEGNWTYTAKFWMTPDAEPQESTGTGENTIIHDGRFLQQKFNGIWMGQEFNGTGLTGYDNIKKEYVSTWFDNMSTGIMYSTGQYDSATKTLGQSGTHSCAMTGNANKVYRSEWKVVDAGHTVYSSFTLDANGNEYKEMEITYTLV